MVPVHIAASMPPLPFPPPAENIASGSSAAGCSVPPVNLIAAPAQPAVTA